MTRNHPMIVALTGGLASGKSDDLAISILTGTMAETT